jgi:L-lactate dehydrogenase complex protein LldF
VGMKAYEWAFKNRKNLDLVGGTVKNTMLKLNKNALGNQKEFPTFAKNSFSKTWKLNLKS